MSRIPSKSLATPERIEYLMKARIKHSFGLTCSDGIGPNKLLAKLASDMKKPDGLTIIRPDEVSQIIDPLPIKDLCGVGSKMERHLNLLGIKTIGDLGRFPVDILKRKLGINGLHLHDMGLGIDDSPVVSASDQDRVKPVGHSMTLKRDVSRCQDILKYLLQLSEMDVRLSGFYEKKVVFCPWQGICQRMKELWFQCYASKYQRGQIAFISLMSRFMSLLSCRNFNLFPPRYGFLATRRLPAAVFGPVDFSHGDQVLILSACRCRCSKVQCFPLIAGVLDLW